MKRKILALALVLCLLLTLASSSIAAASAQASPEKAVDQSEISALREAQNQTVEAGTTLSAGTDCEKVSPAFAKRASDSNALFRITTQSGKPR